MRLLKLKANGEFDLTKDIINNQQPYAILSHTWGDDDDEVTFTDLTEGTGKTKPGFRKILFCAKQAARDGLQYFWVDTCCIDKSNNTELSEAINSMFRWYRDAAKCYVYISDIVREERDQASLSSQSWLSAFRESRWFTRGWTLQELIAPQSVQFFCSTGTQLGDKKSMERQLHQITGIAITALRGAPLSTFSIDERMSWAENRNTKREEDKAYSLLGIFDVHLPLIYGEGKNNAIRRLREEVRKLPVMAQLEELEAASESPKLKKELAIRDSVDIKPDVKRSLIDQLYFTEIDERLTNLTAAQGTTCRWFLTKPEYMSWHDKTQQAHHGGFLWIKGNPGTGKSTLMKFLFEEAKLNSSGDALQITLSFFFRARGTEEEKSTSGLYRAILHQLFQKAVTLRESLEWMTPDGAMVVQRDGWSEETLKQTLRHAIQRLGSRSLMIFVDALDECERKQVAGMVCFFEELCDRAKRSQARLQICFSSRHYPTIFVERGIEVILEDETGHTDDIKQYIKSKLRLGISKQADSLRSEILDKSSRIFLWVVLVLDILHSEYPNSSISIKRIRERLDEIPPGLTDLFEMILTRDGENLEQLRVCLKCVLFALRPLEPQELYFAVQLGLNRESSTYWDQDDINIDQLRTFVRSSSKGLAEATRYGQASEVQFIHESVRDFLLGNYENQWSGVSSNFLGHGHELLKECCLAQLNACHKHGLKIPDSVIPPSDPMISKSPQVALLVKGIQTEFPFLEYSVRNILNHANDAQRREIDQRKFIFNFPRQRWVSLHNLLRARPKVNVMDKSVSLLYILATGNLARLIQICPQRDLCFEVENQLQGTPFFAALAANSLEAAYELLKAQVQSQPQNKWLSHFLELYYANKAKSNRFGDFTFSPSQSTFSYAAERCDEAILYILCASKNFDVESKDRFNRTPLSWAAGRGKEELVELLLKKGAATEARDNYGQTPLSRAAEIGHFWVMKLLLEKGADPSAKDRFGRTPLSWASENGHEKAAKILLPNGADLEAEKGYGWTPLSRAAGNGHQALVRLLLKRGADLLSEDIYGGTPLSRAVKNGHAGVADILREAQKDEYTVVNYRRRPKKKSGSRETF
ncbi:Vegetative incompatibility protein HET-E-1 [Lachnellula suecica]|uniref:Vegetative incompatibility protein HET-E-1 n=1 Tax=Lachnellula suecica TaxID=602035 RepID=A0A8T9BX75_9HELO|nr:Vegetative incompatibility protein HET-E-1 [Lachnellula suecica]